MASEIDNKVLINFPFGENYQGTGDISADLESYVQERIGFRNEMILINLTAQKLLFGEMVHPIYMYGKTATSFLKLPQTSPIVHIMNPLRILPSGLQTTVPSAAFRFCLPSILSRRPFCRSICLRGINMIIAGFRHCFPRWRKAALIALTTRPCLPIFRTREKRFSTASMMLATGTLWAPIMA